MAIFLKFVVHDAVNSTLEATWQQAITDASGNVISYQNVKCENYTAAGKAQFLSDLNTIGTVPVDGTKYCVMTGW